MNKLNKPLMVFDGDCYFCRSWIARWKSQTGSHITYVPYQDEAVNHTHIPLSDFKSSIQLIMPNGSRTQGAAAVFQALAIAGKKRWLLGIYEKFPLFASLSERLYRLVANHRPFFSRLTALLWGAELALPTYFIPRWIFLRLLGLVYFIAFVSLYSQLFGLIGEDGILPASSYLKAVFAQAGSKSYQYVPSLFWFSSSNLSLELVCLAGVALSLLLIIGVAQVPVLLLLWACYLSFLNVSGAFLGFQWDILLLEAGFLAIFIAPFQIKPTIAREPSPPKLIVFLFHWLAFRLMFLSGMVKYLSGDKAWRDLTALNVHYQTQPLPTWTSWYIHHLPDWFHQFSVLGMFFIELLFPFFIFAPRRIRYLGFFGMAFLMVLIAGSGNYCFFNLLSIAIFVFLLDDSFWPKKIRHWFENKRAWAKDFPLRAWHRFILIPVSIVILVVTTFHMAYRMRMKLPWPSPIVSLVRLVDPFHSMNSYGLFAVMTTTRPEIIVEGSNDGERWLPYEFKYKPGDLTRAPAFVAPHQPRLDWQMWFAALSDYRRNRWFVAFCQKLLEGSVPVLELLDKNPFPEKPPRYIRARTEMYTFSSPQVKKETGQWWETEPKGLYIPPLSLRE